MQPRMSACDLGSFGISRTSRDTLNESDMEMWSPACVTWREALAAAFPIMADWPISAGTPSGTAVRLELRIGHDHIVLFVDHRCCMHVLSRPLGCIPLQVQISMPRACTQAKWPTYGDLGCVAWHVRH